MGKIADRILGTRSNKGTYAASKLAPPFNPHHASERKTDAAEEKQYPRHYRPQLEEWDVQRPYGKHKFIIVDHPQIGEAALCFPGYLVHADMAGRVFSGLTVISAGFYEITEHGDAVTTFGKSESLGVPSRRDPVGKRKDVELIEQSLGMIRG